MRIRVLCFAHLRELLAPAVVVELSSPATVSDLWSTLREQGPTVSECTTSGFPYNDCRMLLRLAILGLSMLLTSAVAQDAPNPSLYPHIPVQRNAQSQAKSDSAPTISVEVKLVNVFTSVADADGAPYANLQKEDFRIFEDGVEQTVAVFERESGLPLSIVMALDTSMSTQKDLPLEIASARKFARTILRPVDAISVLQFSTFVSEVLPFTNDEHRLETALTHLRHGAATALYDAIFLSARALDRRKGRKVIVLITDGGDTSSSTSYQEAVRAAQISEAIIFPIIMVPIEADAGRDTGGEHALIQLAHDTGGKFYYASLLSQLDDAFHQISDELRTQYLLAYYPAKRVGGDFRSIKVEITAQARQRARRELYVRHRAGYYNSKIE
ncbi:MAG: VWA domain-containing protein [Acidobacteria bacterium]|nr:MAG: VWA domain-containing protein [Acidobacteriota bacterium]